MQSSSGAAAGGDKKATGLDLSKYYEKQIRVKFSGGREVLGTLKGYDQLVNLVLDDCVEYVKDAEDPYKPSDATRALGLVVCRGTTVTMICPSDGMQEIENPFRQPDAE